MNTLIVLVRIIHCALLFAPFSILSIGAKAQNSGVVEISYQETTTKIRSQAADEYGNTYYAGVFKGALVINGDTMAFGKGGDDYFLAKETNDGQISWALPFGSSQNDNQLIRILYQNSNIYLSFATPYPIEIANQTIPLLQPVGLTSCLLKLDTSGNIEWKKRSNIQLSELYVFNGSILWRCSLSSTGPAALLETDTVANVNGYNTALFMKINDQGQLVDRYAIYNEFNGTSYLNIIVKTNHKLNRQYFLISATNQGTLSGYNAIHFNRSRLYFPPSSATTMIVKTDTLFKPILNKTINPGGGLFYSGASNESRLRFSADSTQLHLMINFGSYSTDAYNEDLTGKNAIAIIDSNLNTNGIKIINTNGMIAGQYRVRIISLQEIKNHFFIFGFVTGQNQSPSIVEIPADNRQVQLAKNYSIGFNFNGPTKSFILKTNREFEFESIHWLTDQSVYENAQAALEEFLWSSDKLQFLNGLDNTWNPWKLNNNLQVLAGNNRQNADQSDYIEKVKYFSNKSKLLLGLSNGVNAFDETETGIVKAGSRRDFFYAVIDSNENVLKYNRLFSSYGSTIFRGVKAFGDSIYVLLRLTSPRNQAGFNYFKLGDQSKIVTATTQNIMIAFDPSGNFTIRDMSNTVLGEIWSFDIFPNGDFAFLTVSTTLALNFNGKVFPNRVGFYIARSRRDGQLLQTMKVYPKVGITSASPNEIFIEKETEKIIVHILSDIPSNGPDIEIISARNGSQETSVIIPNPTPNSPSKKYYSIIFKTSFSQNEYAYAIGPFSSFLISAVVANNRDKLYIAYRTGPSNDLVKYQNQTLLPSESIYHSGIFYVDKNGTFISKINFAKVPDLLTQSFNILSTKFIGNDLYVSGMQLGELQFGALKIPYTGEGDGLILKLDTSLNLVQYYRVASDYYEYCSDIDINADSGFMIAYRSQGSPIQSVGLNEVMKQTFTGGILPSDLEESGYVSLAPPSFAPPDFVYTIKNGSWHDPSTWSNAKVPSSSDRVIIRHKVQIYQNAACFTLFLDPNADLKTSADTELTITGVNPVFD